jgi:hypothetical protein
MTTGYSASPTILYNLTPSPIGIDDNELDAVAVFRDSVNGDTVYFADLFDGIFAFPDANGTIPIANGQPAALYMVSTQGAETLTLDGQGNLYLAVYSTAISPSGGDALAQIMVNNVTVPATPIGTPVSPSTTLNPVTTILNDTACTGSPAPSVTFVANASTTATATADAVGVCSSTYTGGASFATTVSFTPIVAGANSISLTGTDQAGNVGNVTINSPNPDFTLSSSAPTLSVVQGSSNTDTIKVSDTDGFTGAVTLAATGLPSGVTAAFAANPTTNSSVLTLTASSTATAGGPVTVTINGTSGALAASTMIALTVAPPPDFTLSASSASVTVAQGAHGTSTISVADVNGFAGAVALSASGLPSGVTAAFATNPATNSSVLTLTASSTATTGGPVTVTINGTSGALAASTTIALTVAPPPGFTLSASPASVTVAQGASATSTVLVTEVGGFAGAVSLSASGLPSGVTVSFATNPATNSSMLTLTASSTAATGGPVTVTINGTSGALAASTMIALTVAPPPGFTLSVSPASVTVAQGASATGTVLVTEVGGFAGAVSLSASGLPSGVTAFFATNPATNSSMLTLTASSTAATGGPVTVTLTGSSGTLTASTAIALTVTPPSSFTLSGPSITVVAGATTGNTSTITVIPSNGFTGTINLSCSIQPAAVSGQLTCSLMPTSVTIAETTPQTSTLTVTSTATKISRNRINKLIWPSTGGTALALLLLCGIPRRRRNWLAMIGLLVLFVSLGAIGCTGGGGGGTQGTAPQSYTITVTGASGTLTETGQISLTIQ